MDNSQIMGNTNRTNDTVKVLGILRVVFSLLGLVFLLFSLVIYAYGNIRIANWSQTEGTVVSLRARSINSTALAPLIDYTVNGKKYSYYSNIYSSISSYQVGNKVSIFYDPANPQNADLVTDRLDQLLTLIFAIIGLSFMLTSGVLWIIRANLAQKQR